MRGFRIPFDGHILVGDTGGDLKSSSLKSQTEQACAVIGAAGLTRPFSVLAASMGGYTAVHRRSGETATATGPEIGKPQRNREVCG
jgi:hypothetical protein